MVESYLPPALAEPFKEIAGGPDPRWVFLVPALRKEARPAPDHDSVGVLINRVKLRMPEGPGQPMIGKRFVTVVELGPNERVNGLAIQPGLLDVGVSVLLPPRRVVVKGVEGRENDVHVLGEVGEAPVVGEPGLVPRGAGFNGIPVIPDGRNAIETEFEAGTRPVEDIRDFLEFGDTAPSLPLRAVDRPALNIKAEQHGGIELLREASEVGGIGPGVAFFITFTPGPEGCLVDHPDGDDRVTLAEPA